MKVPIRFVLPFCLAGLSIAEEPAVRSVPGKFQVIHSRRAFLGKQVVTLNRVAVPQASTSPIQALAQPTPASPSQPIRHVQLLSVSATVYNRAVTEIRWSGSRGEYVAFSNIDFNHFIGCPGFAIGDLEYSLVLGIGNETSAPLTEGSRDARFPELQSFSAIRSEYFVLENDAHPSPTEDELQALDALHVYYDENKPRLTSEYLQREVANAERARVTKAQPAAPRDITVNFWRKPSAQPQAESAK